MKKTKTAALLFALCAANVAYAADPTIDEGTGKITFVGSIIDAPCTISSTSVDQTIQMGQISNAALDRLKESTMVNFDIKLEGCTLDTATTVDVTFTGVAETGTHIDKLALNGTAAGAAIQLFNLRSTKPIELGTATTVGDLVLGDNTLRFGAKLVNISATKADITPGTFEAATHFVMAYK